MSVNPVVVGVDGTPASKAALRYGLRSEASRDADLLLLARRPHGFPWGHLGATGRAVLRESRCPLEVLPPAAEPVDLDGLVLEQDGAIEKEATRDERDVPAAP